MTPQRPAGVLARWRTENMILVRLHYRKEAEDCHQICKCVETILAFNADIQELLQVQGFLLFLDFNSPLQVLHASDSEINEEPLRSVVIP